MGNLHDRRNRLISKWAAESNTNKFPLCLYCPTSGKINYTRIWCWSRDVSEDNVAVFIKTERWQGLAIHDFDFPAKQIFSSNILLIICCAFYMAWWLLAFKPAGAIKGMKTGWLLIPAVAAGVFAIILAVKGILSASIGATLFPNGFLLWGGIAAYFIFMAVTLLLFKRPVTTELFLIVGWAVLAMSEINTLYGIGRFSYRLAVIFAVVIVAAMLVSLVCYLLYYNLDARAGYFDGMVPLLMTMLVMACISAAMAV